MNRFLILMLLACGTLPPPEKPHAIMSGDYWLDVFPGEKTGTCDFLGNTAILGTIQFDDAGVMKSPLEGVVTCVTSYPEGLVSLTCKGLGNTLNADARGVGTDKDGGIVETAWGDGSVTGNVSGCRRMIFGFGVRRPKS